MEITPEYRTAGGTVIAVRGVGNVQGRAGDSSSTYRVSAPEVSLFAIGDFGRIEIGERAGFPQSLVGFTPSEIAFAMPGFGPESGARLDPNGRLPTSYLSAGLASRIDALSYLGYGIHVRNVCNSLVAALEQTFEVTCRLVGSDFFAQVARAFVADAPPHCGWLTAYGGRFPSYLDRSEGAADYGYLADVARIEWARIEAAFGDEAPALDLDMLAALAPDELLQCRIMLHSSATIIQSAFPIYRIWMAHQDQTTDQSSPPLSEVFGNENVLVARNMSGDVSITPLRPGAATFFAALQAQGRLDKAWARALDADPQFNLGGVLARFHDRLSLASSPLRSVKKGAAGNLPHGGETGPQDLLDAMR